MEIVRIFVDNSTIDYQSYKERDENLIVSNFIDSKFSSLGGDVVEFGIYDNSDTLLDYEYNCRTYTPVGAPQNGLTYSSISVNPKRDLESLGYNRGSLRIQYNFIKNLFGSAAIGSKYWIKDISKSRTELRLSSQDISDNTILSEFQLFDANAQNRNYQSDFYLNFGLNKLVLCTNAAVEQLNDNQETYLLIKLYEPLPVEFKQKDVLWIVEKLAESVLFNVNIDVEAEVAPVSENLLRGPNFNVEISNQIGQTTGYYNYSSLFSSEVSSSIQQLSSYYDDKAVAINVDYTDFSNFVHFSSATERLENFVYKLQLIEQYENEISSSQTINSNQSLTVSYISQSIQSAKDKIDNIVKKFDTYEYYLYYESESFAWPKSTSTKPYKLFATTSSQAIAWLGDDDTLPNPSNPLAVSMLFSASLYDSNNNDIITNTAPQYLIEDPNNAPMVSFMYMLGQHFDNIWLYYKDVTNRFDATNNPKSGISMDLVGNALKGLGFKLHTNTNLSNNLYYSLFGMNPDGSLLPPTGSELIEINALGNRGYVTSSIDTLSANDIQKELYKRIYHNLPLLYKSKGSQRALRALIACYGIPDTILEPSEFGAYPRYRQTGLSEINNSKVLIYNNANELSQSVLSPYTTIQKNNFDSFRRGSYDIEVGFSPANTINKNLQSSSLFVDIDQLIGNPNYQYLDNYPDLESYRNTYFSSSYNYPHSVWEYMRLIKYYNNSLFKTIKDFVPARANVQSGIVIKSHVLERNKYARNEPSLSVDLKSAKSILVKISGGNSSDTHMSSSWIANKFKTPTGSVHYISTQSVEFYNGEFSGSRISAVDENGYMEQKELSSNYTAVGEYSSSIYVNYGGLLHNVTASARSRRFLNLDYTSGQKKPVNLNIITASYIAIASASRNYENAPIYCNPNYPYAEVQDTNYTSRAFTDLRYYGTKTVSRQYNDYTNGDKSYGRTAAIDKLTNYFVYLVDIFTASVFFPERSNAQIKYLIDANENIIDLTKTNSNIFEVQNIFKSQQSTDIALFQYDERNPYTQKLVNNPSLKIFDGGYRYIPVYHNLSGSLTRAQFDLVKPIDFVVPSGSSQAFSAQDPQWKLTNYSLFDYNVISSINYPEGFIEASVGVTASYDPGGTFPGGYSASLIINVPRLDGLSTETMIVYFTPGGPTLVSSSIKYVYDTAPIIPDPIISALDQGLAFVSNIKNYPDEIVGNYSVFYVESVFTSQSGLFYNTASQTAVIKLTDTYGTEDIYKNYSVIYSSSSDLYFTGSGLERVVKPFLLKPGDFVSFRDTGSIGTEGWNRKNEFCIKTVEFTGSYNEAESRIVLTFNRNIPLGLLYGPISSNGVDSTTKANFSSSNFIIWRHEPDETNIVLDFDPTDPTIKEEGLLYPEYISEDLKLRSGNIIKSLKSQNLIQTTTNIA